MNKLVTLVCSVSPFSSEMSLKCKSMNGGETIEKVLLKKSQSISIETNNQKLAGCVDSFVVKSDDPMNPVMRLNSVMDEGCLYFNFQSEFGYICN